MSKLTTLEALDNGLCCFHNLGVNNQSQRSGLMFIAKLFKWAKENDITMSIRTIQYFPEWANKVYGNEMSVCVGFKDW
jgi:hypothetical protein